MRTIAARVEGSEVKAVWLGRAALLSIKLQDFSLMCISSDLFENEAEAEKERIRGALAVAGVSRIKADNNETADIALKVWLAERGVTEITLLPEHRDVIVTVPDSSVVDIIKTLCEDKDLATLCTDPSKSTEKLEVVVAERQACKRRFRKLLAELNPTNETNLKKEYKDGYISTDVYYLEALRIMMSTNEAAEFKTVTKPKGRYNAWKNYATVRQEIKDSRKKADYPENYERLVKTFQAEAHCRSLFSSNDKIARWARELRSTLTLPSLKDCKEALFHLEFLESSNCAGRVKLDLFEAMNVAMRKNDKGMELTEDCVRRWEKSANEIEWFLRWRKAGHAQCKCVTPEPRMPETSHSAQPEECLKVAGTIEKYLEIIKEFRNNLDLSEMPKDYVPVHYKNVADKPVETPLSLAATINLLKEESDIVFNSPEEEKEKARLIHPAAL